MRHPSGRTRLGTRVALAGSVGALVAATACGSVSTANASPQASFDSALSALRSSSALTTTVRVDLTSTQLRQIAAASGHAAVPAAVLNLVPAGQLVVSEATTNGQPIDAVKQQGAAGLADLTSDISLTEHGTRVVELRMLNQTMYAHVDVSALLADLGPAAQAKISALQAKVPASLTFVHTLLNGGWVSVSLSQLGALGKMAPGTGSSTGPTGAQELPGKIAAILKQDVTVTSPATDQYTLSGNVRTLATAFVQALQQVTPAAAGPLGSFTPAHVPSRTLTLQATTNGSVLTKLVFNAAQLEPAAMRAKLKDMPARIELDFTQSAPTISAPTGAQPVDLTQLLPLLAGLGHGTSA